MRSLDNRVAHIVYRGDDEFETCLRGGVCAFGVFDGVHLGHQLVIDSAIEEADCLGVASVALTFDIDPDELFCPGTLAKLMTNDARIDLLAHSGVDVVAIMRFTYEFAAQEPEVFLETVFGNAKPAGLHVGDDFRFGTQAKGTLETLEAWGSAQGVHIVGHKLLEVGGMPVTSTRIRKLLAEGKADEALSLLGHEL